MVSVDILNNGPRGLVVVVPVTTVGFGLRSHVELEPASSALEHTLTRPGVSGDFRSWEDLSYGTCQ